MVDLDVDSDGDLYYVVLDKQAAKTNLERLASGSTSPEVLLSFPFGTIGAMAVDRADFVFLVPLPLQTGPQPEPGPTQILEYRPQTGEVTPIAAVFGTGIVVDPFGHLYVARTDRRLVWVNRATGAVTPVAGTGILGFSGDGGPALESNLAFGTGLVSRANGDLVSIHS